MQFNNKSLLHIAACCQAKSSIKCLIELGHDQDRWIVNILCVIYTHHIIRLEYYIFQPPDKDCERQRRLFSIAISLSILTTGFYGYSTEALFTIR